MAKKSTMPNMPEGWFRAPTVWKNGRTRVFVFKKAGTKKSRGIVAPNKRAAISQLRREHGLP